ncbi:fructose-2,6-bisphosphatase [Bellilinea caldifistulae]|uniref:histidine phosphatase family protein n=1 Tax=Bellilinea caldifistulae TaxID=360411 RepID=UPI000780BB0E|nr:histidine phosphatase family protein [Bellilinea caldifistulae]GAP10646.1 fructose-2,6-bisphosphatase [Bellilinea caldifistulae]
MRILFIRHAQSTNNLLWDQTGSSDGRSSDPTLTELGIKQSLALCDYFGRYLALNSRGSFPDTKNIYLYSSLMWRSLQTAQPIADEYSLPILGLRDLHEVGGVYLKDPETELNVGLPGKKPSDLQRAFPRLQFVQEPDEQGWYNAAYESDDQAHARAKRLMDWLINRHRNSPHVVVLVSHGAFFNYFMNELLGINPPYRGWFVMNNTGVTQIEVEEEEIYVLFVNRVDHLPADWIS